jgi:hypothetical protein
MMPAVYSVGVCAISNEQNHGGSGPKGCLLPHSRRAEPVAFVSCKGFSLAVKAPGATFMILQTLQLCSHYYADSAGDPEP